MNRAFWLIVVIIAVQLMLAIGNWGVCVYAGFNGFNTDKCTGERINDLLSASLAVALSLYIGKDK